MNTFNIIFIFNYKKYIEKYNFFSFTIRYIFCFVLFIKFLYLLKI